MQRDQLRLARPAITRLASVSVPNLGPWTRSVMGSPKCKGDAALSGSVAAPKNVLSHFCILSCTGGDWRCSGERECPSPQTCRLGATGRRACDNGAVNSQLRYFDLVSYSFRSDKRDPNLGTLLLGCWDLL